MTASPPRTLPVLSLRTMAILLLLAWVPVLLFVDHLPAPALLRPAVTTTHVHDTATAGANAHVEHGHGGAATSVAGPVVVAPTPAAPDLAPPVLHNAAPVAPLRSLHDVRPVSPPPR